MKALVLAALEIYRRTARCVMPPCCRFHPSCSDYAHEAVLRHGCVRGLILSLKRLARCHPLHPGGLDPVPPVSA
ncbi:MAG TPA: membrane protein insertion efficiency factor YidD [Elusimicrobia bacterium]|nr:membrane protein insertion efficiency factor YidD [Elusimicrobiota bacterium]HBT62277.1 membrane protein insertion efficiency factor YidD [Elusimicrobiota bacterium]